MREDHSRCHRLSHVPRLRTLVPALLRKPSAYDRTCENRVRLNNNPSKLTRSHPPTISHLLPYSRRHRHPDRHLRRRSFVLAKHSNHHRNPPPPAAFQPHRSSRKYHRR
ncbi:hypothetical protein IEQ34_020409 [Dendrobium chrysotoxum]|uniref:Uncharacterized protein n=1 Tax=Dendrobium chrysotoxum TaxID=161865 RepID=A0AAV7G2P7_DENCH|nr:hypothetical protein IEQ34_020409 [Dendrobium chrysotoxum]